MSNRNERKQNLRLEYQEIHLWLRHMELAWWGVAVLLMPFAVTVLYKGATDWQVLVVGGISMLLIWLGYMKFTKFLILRELVFMDRAEEIEKELGLKFVTLAGEQNKDDSSKGDSSKGLEKRARPLISNEFARSVFFGGEKLTWGLFVKSIFPEWKNFTWNLPENYRFHDFMIGVYIVIVVSWFALILWGLVGVIFHVVYCLTSPEEIMTLWSCIF